MGAAPNWGQLTAQALQLVLVFFLVIAFVCVLTYCAGKSLSHLAEFFSHALKAEFTERPGWLDLALFFLFCLFVYGPSVEQDVLEALRLSHLSSDTSLMNPNLKLVATLIALLASLVFVGLFTAKPAGRRRSKK